MATSIAWSRGVAHACHSLTMRVCVSQVAIVRNLHEDVALYKHVSSTCSVAEFSAVQGTVPLLFYTVAR